MRVFGVLAAAAVLSGTVSSGAASQYNRYGVHEVTAPPPTPTCNPAGGVLCFVDSTRHYSNECCASSSTSHWLVLAKTGDSLEFYAQSHGLHAFLTLQLSSRRGWQEHLPGLTAPFLRLRVPEGGTYVLTVDLDPLDSAIGLPYELRVRTPLHGQQQVAAPLVNIVGTAKARIDVRPHGLKRDAAPRTSYVVRAGSYRVYAPGIDSLDICLLPCRTPRTVAITNARAQTIRP